MNAVCPGCGVAIVAGYVRCPKCHAALPRGLGMTPAAGVKIARMNAPGGTAVAGGRGMVMPIAGAAVVGLAIVLFLVLKQSPPAPPSLAPDAGQPEAEEEAIPEPATSPTPAAEAELPSPNRFDPSATARDLERALGRQRLWSSVQVIGDEVEIRSGSCRDVNLMPTVDAARAALRNAGLTRLRCLEQSGSVVFERAL
jgi:hypothetical protein